MKAPAARILALLAVLAAPAAPAAAQRDSAFMQEFRKLMAIKADDEMAALIRRHEHEAVLAVIETCTKIGEGSSDELEEEISALNRIWKKVYDSRFVDLQYNYFSVELQGAFRKHWFELRDRFVAKRKEFDLAEKDKNMAVLPQLGVEFKGYGDAFTELGDHYMAGQCYRTYAVCYDDGLNDPAKVDYRSAAEGWRLFVETREKIELKDKAYVEAKARFEKLEYDGFGDPEKGPEARGEEKVVESDVVHPATPLGGTFQLVPDIEAIRRPIYTADANFQVWPAVNLQGVDSSGQFQAMDPAAPRVIRTGANKAVVDVNGDGTGEVDIPLTGKITPVEFTLGEGDAQRKWGFLAVIGQERDTYQGINPWNLAPNDQVMNLYVAPAASLVATLNGTRVQVFDDNMDGVYGSAPLDWAYPGLVQGAFQHDVDSILVGEAKAARPWSKLQKIGEAWYELAPDEIGKDVTARPIEVRTGTLQLDMKGPSVDWLVVRGVGDDKHFLYDVVNGGTNKVEVPVGTYELYSGQVSSGKKSQMVKALILPRPQGRTWKVQPGETTKLELGAPFGCDFTVSQDETTITIDGNSIAVVGRGGETYQRLWNCALSPEVNLRKAGSSKGKKEGKLTPIGSQEQLEDHKNDWRVAWFPVGTPLDKPAQGEEFEAQLFVKKHELFGKIESAWKAR